MATVKVTFKANPTLPPDQGGRRWLHTPGGRKLDADGKTYRMVEPVFFESGRTYEVEPKEAQWLVAHTPPGTFKVEEAAKPAPHGKKNAAPAEPDEPETD